MLPLQLSVYLLLKDKELAGFLEDLKLPEGVVCSWYHPKVLNLPTDEYVVLITDQKEHVLTACAKKPKQRTIVYVGDAEDVISAVERVDSIWPSNESARIRKARFKKLIGVLRRQYDAWFYENALMTAIDSIPELVWYKDVKGEHLRVNEAFCKTVHKTKEQVQGRGHYYIWDITPEEYNAGEFVCMESEEEVMEAGETRIFEEPVLTQDGMRHFTTYKSPLFDEFGRIIGTVGVAHDVTDKYEE
ncbi:MAG: PAS domain-containing protein [Lachnospiraceae bacterium]|nr:PAS domain-containing protein [Lachnospiraceae bacterium]